VKPILARTLERSVERPHAILDMPINVLDHYDGVVDHESHRDGQRHERDVVEAEAARYMTASAPSRDSGTTVAGMSVTRRFAQEQQDDKDHKSDGQPERELDIVDRGTNGLGAVGQDVDRDGWRNRGLEGVAARSSPLSRFR
jgi:hypothetical protein